MVASARAAHSCGADRAYRRFAHLVGRATRSPGWLIILRHYGGSLPCERLVLVDRKDAWRVDFRHHAHRDAGLVNMGGGIRWLVIDAAARGSAGHRALHGPSFQLALPRRRPQPQSCVRT